MPEPISFGELDFNLVASMGKAHGVHESETHFRILLMGDFSGRANRGQDSAGAALINLQPLVVDRDNFDTLFAKLGVQIHLSMGEKQTPVCISFSELDDFHPDSLYRRLPVFQALKETRESLKDPSAFAVFTEELLKAPSLEKETQLPESVSVQPSGDLLDQIIEKSQFEDQQTSPAKSSTQWDSFLHSIVKPHLVPKAHPRQEEMIDAVDAFNFEEMPIPPVHGNYLWGNPCFALILLLGQAFSLYGRQMQPDSVLEINSLPLHVYKEEGESHVKPCAETLLSHRGAEQIMKKGLMPLLSSLNQDMVRLGRFQSIADPLSRLSGPWQ